MADTDRLGSHDEEPSTRHGHHHVPNQRRHSERNLQLPEAHPRRESERLGRFGEFVRYGSQRLIKAEGHVPSLARENRKNGREFRTEHAAGRERHEEHDRNRDESQNRHGLQDVEQRHQEFPGAFALRGPGRISQRKDHRQRERGQHTQSRSRRVFRQVNGIERERRDVELRQGNEHAARGFAEKGDQTDHDDEGDDIPARHEIAQETKRFETPDGCIAQEDGPLESQCRQIPYFGRSSRVGYRVLSTAGGRLRMSDCHTRVLGAQPTNRRRPSGL